MDPVARARALVDEAHAADPIRASDGRPAELAYADRMETWVARLFPDATPLLLLAARCQHLERWSVPRESFPMNRAGYNSWRRTLYRQQSERARALLLAAGLSDRDAEDVATWVAKTDLLRNPGTQALEDAACLVFLETEIDGFVAKHEDYSREKYLTILKRIWRKMSPTARESARAIPMNPTFRDLLAEAAEG